MSIRVYPVVNTELFCDDYKVKINGISAETNVARVSAVPSCRRWPGHQRSIDQTELIQFLSFSMDGPVEIEITPKENFDHAALKIRPHSLGITPNVVDGVIKFTLEKPTYVSVEPFGRNRAFHIFADSPCDFGIDKASENVIYYGAGEHEVGLITLHSGETLFIDEGAVVYGRVEAIDADNISILGHGILDNSRTKETILFEARAEDNHVEIKNAKRENSIKLEYCTNVLIDGITMRDSLVYNIRPYATNGIEIRNVKIIGCWRYNSDGIDMHNCIDVHIDNCFVRTFDDAICVKGFDCYYDGDIEAAVHAAMYRGGKAYDVFKNVLVENCVIWNDWGKGLEIGAETRAEEICDVTFRNCDIIHVMHAPLDSMNVDFADTHDIYFENINIELDEKIPQPRIQLYDAEVYESLDPDYTPFATSLTVEFHHEYSAGGARRGKNRNYSFKNINIIGDKPLKMRFAGYDEAHKTENVTFENFFVNGKHVTGIDAENLVLRDFVENVRFIDGDIIK